MMKTFLVVLLFLGCIQGQPKIASLCGTKAMINIPDGLLLAAIIGGGIAGTSLAHFLSQSIEVNLTLFEANEEIGGRLRTVQLANQTYECGGTIIHPANQLMAHLVQEMGLNRRRPGPDSRITLIGSQNTVLFQQSAWSWLQPLQFIYRYGLFSMLKLHYYISNMLEHFSTIYAFLEQGNYTENIEDMLKIMTPKSRKNRSDDKLMNDLTQVSLSEELLNVNMAQNLIEELVTAAVRTNYGQVPDQVHAFVGSVALAGAEGDLWSIEGGNHLLAEKLLHSSRAFRVQSKVAKVAKTLGGAFQIFSTQNEDLGIYDIAILATPLTDDTSTLQVEGQSNFPGSYHRTVATLVHGQVDPGYIGLSQDQLTMTNFVIDPTTNVNSFALLAPVNYLKDTELPSVWKVFSQKPLTQQELDNIFKTREQVVTCDWLAYPHYSAPQSQSTLASKFKLDDNLYHINAVEWAASAMEMSVIGAKNVANMIIENHRQSMQNTGNLNRNEL